MKKMIVIQVLTDAGLIAIKALHKKMQIKILDEIDLDSPALPGPPMSLKAFRDWIAIAEKASTMSLEEAEKRWDKETKQIRKLIK
jgi:hypothetical protein